MADHPISRRYRLPQMVTPSLINLPNPFPASNTRTLGVNHVPVTMVTGLPSSLRITHWDRRNCSGSGVFTDVRAEDEETVQHWAYNTKYHNHTAAFRYNELTLDLPQKKKATNKMRREAARIAAHHMTSMWLVN